MRITKKKYFINTNIDKEVTIVVLADVHYYSKRNIKKLNKVLNTVEKIKPNYICIPGDLMDSYYVKDEECVIDWIKRLSIISPVLISIGNHEFIAKKKSYNLELFSKIQLINNCYVLDNKSISFENISFLGITIPGEYFEQKKDDNYIISNLKNINYNPNKYNIMLCHSPIDFYKEKIFNNLEFTKSCDLLICGHMHGGITPNILKPLLKGRGFIRPDGKLFANMCYGLYDNLGTKCIISSGVTKSSHTNKFEYLDFLFSPEVTVIKLRPKP